MSEVKTPRDLWTHKKYAQAFRSSTMIIKGQKFFVLQGETVRGLKRKIVFAGTYHAAKKAGWEKVK